MLKTVFTDGFNPFNFILCPACESNSFTSIDFASVWCDKCNSNFYTNKPGGDSGVIVTCEFKFTWKTQITSPEFLANFNSLCKKKKLVPSEFLSDLLQDTDFYFTNSLKGEESSGWRCLYWNWNQNSNKDKFYDFIRGREKNNYD